MVVVPLEEIRPQKRPKATTSDLERLQQMLIKHFGGLTKLPNSVGFGRRDPASRAQQPEMNYNAYYVAYATPIGRSEAYFQALQSELQDAMEEGVILIERQEVWLV
jgi:hypothetical protein